MGTPDAGSSYMWRIVNYGDLKSIHYESTRYGGAYHCREGGRTDDPTMVLLHGHMAHAIAYRRVWNRLAKSFHVLVPDLPGHGWDETFRDLQVQPHIESMGRWLFDLLDLCAHGPVHLVGHSLGASLAYQAALDDSTRVRSVTLISPGFCVTAPPGAATFLEYLPARLARLAMSPTGMRLIEPFRWQGQPMNREEAEAYVRPLTDVARLEFALRMGAELVRRACEISRLEPPAAPTLLIFGRGDDFVDVDAADEVADQLGADRLEVFDKSGHSPPEDTPVECADTVLEFVGAE